ncbi:hypothetical protein B0O80DRAFT_425745 [Mortierella sp. GBAus27b]|nr:hypothetical protein B0O80DRAFT_425745 [Mortierella sp. GBAus27b]
MKRTWSLHSHCPSYAFLPFLVLCDQRNVQRVLDALHALFWSKEGAKSAGRGSTQRFFNRTRHGINLPRTVATRQMSVIGLLKQGECCVHQLVCKDVSREFKQDRLWDYLIKASE